jgi:hypothetical protein
MNGILPGLAMATGTMWVIMTLIFFAASDLTKRDFAYSVLAATIVILICSLKSLFSLTLAWTWSM